MPGPAHTVTADVTALKEWAAVVHALLAGRQTMLLRKGGIHERSFVTTRDRFVLFPTVAHSHEARVRPEHRDLLAVGAGDVDEEGGRFTVRCAVIVDEVVVVKHPGGLPALAREHIWTDEHVQERLAFRPRHPLQILVVRAAPLVPVTIGRRPEYDGCRSWVELPVEVAWDRVDGTAAPGEETRRAAERIREAVA